MSGVNLSRNGIAGGGPGPFGGGDVLGLGRSAALARNWWAVALRGALAILLGLIALALPGVALLSLALVFAAYLVIDGALALTSAIRAASHHERWGWLLAEGVVNLAVGVLAAFFPAGAIFGFVILAAAWGVVTGIFMILAAMRLHGSHGRIWLGLGGTVSVVWGLVVFAAPLIGALVLAWWLGLYALVFGIAMLMVGFRLRAAHRQVAPAR